MKLMITKFNNIPFEIFYKNSYLFFKKDFQLFKFNYNFDIELMFEHNLKFIIVDALENEVCIRDNEKLIFIEINKLTKRFINLPLNNPMQIKSINQDYIVIRYNNGENWVIDILDKIGQKLWTLSYNLTFISFIFKDKLFVYKDEENKLELYDLLNRNEKWQQSFSSLMPSQETEEIFISQEIIEISNVIYFTLNTNNQYICFGLDAETGKVLKQFPNILGDLIQENEYIYFLYYNSITRLNTTNYAIEKWDIQDLLDKAEIDYLYFPRWAVLEGQIYFSQTKGSDIHSGKKGARFGILDFEKKELIFKDQLDPKYGTIGNIKVSKERLYLHTQDSTLHVFEKLQNF